MEQARLRNGSSVRRQLFRQTSIESEKSTNDVTNDDFRDVLIASKRVQPTATVPPETVFLCRRVYDVKLKRFLKNPQVSSQNTPPLHITFMFD